MTTTSRESLDRLEHEAQQARATVSSQLAQVRHRLEPQVLKNQAEGIKDQLIDRARAKSSEFIEERKSNLKQTLVDAAMNNPAPTLALGTIVAWSLWRRFSQIPAPILLIGAGGLAGLMRWNDGSERMEDQRTYAAGYGYPRPDAYRTHAADYGYPRPEAYRTHAADYGSVRPEAHRTYAADYGSARPEAQWRPGEEQTGGSNLSSIAEPARDAVGRAQEMASEAGARVSEATARAGSAVSAMAGRTAGGISRAAGDAATTASDLGRRARSELSDLFERHPLVLGGLGLALGAAIAYSFRPTETEARLVGETSDRFKRRAREIAEEQFERARTITERAYEAAWDEAREQGISPEGGREAAAELGRKARAVADRAKEAAREKWDAETTA